MAWKDILKEVFLEHNFDIVVADFFTFPAIYLSDELGIPNLINFPGPLFVLEYMKLNL